MSALQAQQGQHVGRAIALGIVGALTQPGEQGQQALLQLLSALVASAELHQQRGHQQALLGLSHVFFGDR